MAEKQPTTDDIIRYLGYNVHPGKIDEFWTSEDEKKRFIERVRASGGKIGVLDRDAAILNAKVMTGADKIVGFVGSLLLILSFFIPVYSITIGERQISGSAISFFSNLGLIGGYASWGGGVMIAALLLYAAILVICPIVGVLNAIGLLNKRAGESYFQVIREYARYVYIPLFLYILLFLVLLAGTPHPFGSLGMFSDDFNMTAIFELTGIGFWLNIAGIAIILAERREI